MKKFISMLFFTVTLFLSPIYLSAATGDGCSSAENIAVNSRDNNRLKYHWGSNNSYYYYKFTAPADGEIHITTAGFNGDTDAELWNSDCSGNPLASDYSYNINIDITYTVTAGTVYKLPIYNFSQNEDDFTITLDFTPAAPIGCDNSLDTNANSTSPYALISQMHNITTNTSTCISGTTADSESRTNKKDYYYFTVASAGTLSINTSSPNNHKYHLRIGTSPNDTTYYGDRTAQSHNVSNISLNAGDTIYFRFKETGDDTDYYEMNLNFIATGNTDLIADAGQDQNIISGNSVTLNASGSSSANGNIISYVWREGGVQVATGISPTLTLSAGIHTLMLTVTDSNGATATDSVAITITNTSIQAVNDTYRTSMDVLLTANVQDNDTGRTIRVTSNTNPNNGSLSMQRDGVFNYTPNLGFIGTDTFNYTITDANGNTDIATVTITISNSTTIATGAQPFVLVNPASTRNILGNYAILGNTLECVTSNTGGETNPFNGTCQTGTGFNDNNYMTKYIDIDNNITTWNSSSSNFTLPEDLDNNGTQGIAWAGLFWQGSINNNQVHRNNVQRRASLNNGTVTFQNITTTTAINIANTPANKILVKVDNASYTPVTANTMSIDNSFVNNGNNIGGFYGAYTDITRLLQNQNLAEGNHTITIANLTSNEGRQQSTGNYAGWSLVVIYNQKGAFVKARNISIYNGYAPLNANTAANNQASSLIQISGFKLPTEGAVEAQFSSFAGEGEFIYGNGTNGAGNQDFDSMVMKRLATDTGDTMPGAIDSNNIFDARMAGIERTSGKNNALNGNNNGIDIDSYDVSTIMEKYRALDPLLNTVFIGISTNHDYIVPSMIAFSAELYKPKVCYDYTIQQNNYDITAEDNSTAIHTVGRGKLAINIALQSMEGDFDFNKSQISVSLSPTRNIRFSEAFYAPNQVNTLIPATNILPFSNIRPNIAIGEQVTDLGGTIRKQQRYFSQFNYTLESDIYNGSFDVDFNSTINFGSGSVPIIASTRLHTLDRCPQSPYYRPISGTYNIERHNSTGNPSQKYPLYTQVVGKDFDFDLVAYSENNNYNEEMELDHYTVDIELINAKPYNDLNSTFVCSNPDPTIIQRLNSSGKNNHFAQFNESARVDLSTVDIQTDTALRNATFRMWYLVDENNTVIDHNCINNQSINEGCFNALYNRHYRESDTALRADGTHGFCSAEQGGCLNYANAKTGKSGCYACLRDFFSKALCARDNFSIRPAAYRLTLHDTNETDGSQLQPILLETNNISQASKTLASGYKYQLRGQAASYIENNTALGYTRKFVTPSTSKLRSTLVNTNGTICADTNNTDWGINFINGQIKGTVSGTDVNLSSGDLIKHSNVGTYEYYLHDVNWTKVDQSSYPFKTFPNVDDCIVDANTIIVGPTEMPGCNTDSNLTDTDQGTYTNLKLSFMPYSFNLDDVNLTRVPGNNANYIYMNDFKNNFYPQNNLLNPQYSMSMAFQGRVKAYSKDDVITSNFEYDCKDTQGNTIAQAVKLSVEKTFTPADARDNSANPLKFQEFLQDDRFNIINTNKITTDINQTDINDTNTSISSTWFRDPQNMQANGPTPNTYKGSAYIRLDTNIKKPTGSNNIAANPVRILYNKLKVSSPDASSNARMLSNYIPKGENDYDGNITSYFSKIVPGRSLYNPVLTIDTVNNTLLVDIYCDGMGINCGDYNLNVQSRSGENVINWFSADFYNMLTDGQVTLNAMPVPNNINILPVSPINLLNGAVNIAVTGFAANVPVTVFIHPDDPWHFSPGQGAPRDASNGRAGDDYPESFQIVPIGQAAWSGVGKTGNTAGTQSSGSTPRMNW